MDAAFDSDNFVTWVDVIICNSQAQFVDECAIFNQALWPVATEG